MEEIKTTNVQRLHDGPNGPMLPYMDYSRHTLTTDRGHEMDVFVPASAGAVRQFAAKVLLRTRVAFENAFGQPDYDGPSRPTDREV